MTPYERILAAVDLSGDSRAVAARACDLARTSVGTLRLLHVVEFVPIEPISDSLVPAVLIDDQVMAHAKARLDDLAGELGIEAAAACVEAGSVKMEILRHAREQRCDLIVLGSRERHGLSILLNLTEDTVLHGAPCDVLAVRVP